MTIFLLQEILHCEPSNSRHAIEMLPSKPYEAQLMWMTRLRLGQLGFLLNPRHVVTIELSGAVGYQTGFGKYPWLCCLITKATHRPATRARPTNYQTGIVEPG